MGLILYLIPVAIYLFYKWATAKYDFFEKQGIPFIKPLPLLGSNIGLFFKKKPFVQSLMEDYNQFKNDKLYGGFQFRKPVVAIRDPKIVKQLAVKDFDFFTDHQVVIKEEVDPLMGKLLISLEGQKWKDMRSTLSPAFTGSKMRQMFDFVSDVGQQTAKSMRDEIIKGGKNAFEFKGLASKFTVDVIASCAFGIEVNSFKNPENDFYRIAMKVTNLNIVRQIIVFFGYMIFPKLMKMMGFYIMDKELTDFFHHATHETMKVREEKGIVRNDMINLLMQARKGQLEHSQVEEETTEGFATVQESTVGRSTVKQKWDDMDLTAQCLIFFLAGFDTVATTMSLLSYELMCNQDVQQKLYEEIRDMDQELDGKKISYEKIQEMKYLDQVVSEILRKWPVGVATDRVCVKDYDLKYDDKVLHFTKGLLFTIPIYCFHHDPKYFPEPEKFDPERFNEENRGNIDPDTYLPFGVGPRNCIGSRFALMELKTIFYYLLLNFSFEVTEKTDIPFKYEDVPFAMKPLNGIWVALKPRDQ